jgi:hypothetical protein
MFNSSSHPHTTDMDLQSAEILSVHNTSQGQIAYLRCADGRTIVVDYDLVNPYSWRSDNPRRGVVGAPAPATVTHDVAA